MLVQAAPRGADVPLMETPLCRTTCAAVVCNANYLGNRLHPENRKHTHAASPQRESIDGAILLPSVAMFAVGGLVGAGAGPDPTKGPRIR